VEFVKRPDDGKMKGLAFIKDPDGYWIEVRCRGARGTTRLVASRRRTQPWQHPVCSRMAPGAGAAVTCC
jgi:hypothetical protein